MSWVVCAPGDPNERQQDAMISMSQGHRMCAERYNEHTGEVSFLVYRPTGVFTYFVDRYGRTRLEGECPPTRFLMHRSLGVWSLFHDDELVGGSNHVLGIFSLVCFLNQEGGVT